MTRALQILLADRVIPGTGAALLSPGYVAIQDDKIVAVGNQAELTPERFPADVPRVDFPGCTLLPGLCDGHVHLTFSAGPIPFQDLLRDSDATQLLRATANARAALQAGVTTLRDLGSRGQVIYELRDAINKRIIPGPRVLSSGAPITCVGGHLHFLGGIAEGRDGIAKMTEERVEEGAM